jgi:hypothetical protein
LDHKQKSARRHFAMTCQCSCHSSLGDERINTLASVDMELARTRRRVLALLERRNELLPVNRLPAELLSHIIETEKRKKPAQKWQQWLLGVTQVCRRWRTVARSCPTLWNTVDMDYPMLVNQNLHLARSLPLSVHTHAGDSDSVKEALSLFPRSRILDITFSEQDAAMVLSLLPDTEAPHLEFLRLVLDGTEPHDGLEIVVPSIVQAPKLAVLVLHLVPLNWNSLQMCHHIRALCLSFLYPRPDTDAFRDIMEALTRLEVLSIKDCIPWDLDQASQQQSTNMDLSNLKVLEIIDCCDMMLRFMNHISLGPLTRVLLMDTVNRGDNHGIWPVMTNVINKCLQLLDKSVQTLMTEWKHAHYEFRGWAEGLETPTDPPTLHVRIDLTEVHDRYNFRWGTTLLRLTSGIREFQLGRWVNIVRSRPLEAFFPEVHSVTIDGSGASYFIDFLVNHADRVDIWTNLTHLDFSYGNYSKSDLRMLETALSQRTSCTGRQLKQLVIRSGDVFEAKEHVVGMVLHVETHTKRVQYQQFNEVIAKHIKDMTEY